VEHFATMAAARAPSRRLIDEYHRERRHLACGMQSPIDYELALRVTHASDTRAAA
jgi:hypothetical protein